MNRKPVSIAAVPAAATCLADAALAATAHGIIVARTPVFTAVAVPQQQCVQQQQLVRPPDTGAGALIGDRAGAGANPPMAADVQRWQTVGLAQNPLVGCGRGGHRWH